MNDAVQNMIDDLTLFDERTDETLLKLVREKERFVIQLNIDQLTSGVNSDGTSIKPAYRPSTIERKRRRGQVYDRVTLRDEGDFHASFFLVYGNDEFSSDAKDFKRVYLEKRYGPNIYGLTDQNISRLQNAIRDPFFDEFKKVVT